MLHRIAVLLIGAALLSSLGSMVQNTSAAASPSSYSAVDEDPAEPTAVPDTPPGGGSPGGEPAPPPKPPKPRP